MQGLLPLEEAVIDMLLAGDHPSLSKLRAQLSLAEIRSRQSNGEGFFVEFEVPAGVERPSIQQKSLHIADVKATLPELKRGAGFILFVREGRLAMLEAYSFDEPWPEAVTTFALRYTDPSRQTLLAALDD
jgi:hypothetical protein